MKCLSSRERQKVEILGIFLTRDYKGKASFDALSERLCNTVLCGFFKKRVRVEGKSLITNLSDYSTVDQQVPTRPLVRALSLIRHTPEVMIHYCDWFVCIRRRRRLKPNAATLMCGHWRYHWGKGEPYPEKFIRVRPFLYTGIQMLSQN